MRKMGEKKNGFLYNLNLVQKQLGCKNWNDIKISGKESSIIFWTKKIILLDSDPYLALHLVSVWVWNLFLKFL